MKHLNTILFKIGVGLELIPFFYKNVKCTAVYAALHCTCLSK